MVINSTTAYLLDCSWFDKHVLSSDPPDQSGSGSRVPPMRNRDEIGLAEGLTMSGYLDLHPKGCGISGDEEQCRILQEAVADSPLALSLPKGERIRGFTKQCQNI